MAEIIKNSAGNPVKEVRELTAYESLQNESGTAFSAAMADLNGAYPNSKLYSWNAVYVSGTPNKILFCFLVY